MAGCGCGKKSSSTTSSPRKRSVSQKPRNVAAAQPPRPASKSISKPPSANKKREVSMNSQLQKIKERIRKQREESSS